MKLFQMILPQSIDRKPNERRVLLGKKVNNWQQKCEEAVKDWEIGSDKTVVFHTDFFDDALFIREYMESHYADISIFIICQGFIYGTEIRHMGN
jgi:hypothetical protein